MNYDCSNPVNPTCTAPIQKKNVWFSKKKNLVKKNKMVYYTAVRLGVRLG